jgi:hypothetical protein
MNPVRILFTLLLLLIPFARSIGDAPRRLAVVEVEGEEPVTPGLVELVEAGLLQAEDEVVLLERGKINRLLREQELGLSSEAGDFSGGTAVRAGEIWGVDVFCLLSREKKNLRVQLVDAWHGIRMMDILLPHPYGPDKGRTGKMIAGRVLRRLPTVTRDPSGLRMVGILAFTSMEPSREFDALERPVRMAIEQQAQHQPDLLVAEREQVRPLLEERERVDTLPERIRASLVLVDGEFHLDEEDPGRLNLHIRGRRNNSQVFRLSVNGPRNDLELLGHRATAAIGKALGQVPTTAEMDPELEAEMLRAQSMAGRDPSTSLGAAAAARALMPDVEDYELNWLRTLVQYRESVPFTPARLESFLEACERICFRHLSKSDFDPREDLRVPMTLLSQSARLLEDESSFSIETRTQAASRLLGLLQLAWDRYAASPWWEASKGVHPRQESFLELLKRIGPVDSDAAFRLYADIATSAPARTLRQMSSNLVWPADLDDEERFEWNRLFYTWMVSRERQEVRLAGKRGLARIHVHPGYAGSRETSRALYEDFEHEFLHQFLPTRTHDPRKDHLIMEGYPNWITPFLDEKGFDREAGPSTYFEDAKRNLEYRAERVGVLLRTVLEGPEYPQRIDWASSGSLLGPLARLGADRERVEWYTTFTRAG